MKNHFLIIALLHLIQYLPAQSSLVDFITGKYFLPDSITFMEVEVPGHPPVNFKMPAILPGPGAKLLDSVPAYSWSFGCSNTSAAMIAGYYDLHGYPDVYTAITNDGLAPMDNILWGTVTINGETRSQCPLSATMMGLDERPERGHVDDFWIIYRNYGPDPYLVNGWTRHADGDCTGDFMGTSQSVYGNADGNTRFFFLPDGSPLNDYTGNEPLKRDGCHGIKLFFESRGYPVMENYTQLIPGAYGNTEGFTFEQYQAEIDNGRPVILQMAGHSMVGLGYDSGNMVFLHDTWDHALHSMTWGGSYAGMTHWGVTVLNLGSTNKYLTIKVLPEGIYNTTSGLLNKVQDSLGYVFEGQVADKLAICLADSLHNLTCFEDLELEVSGICRLQVPLSMTGSYYLIVKHRNSIETWSSGPVNLAMDSTYYDFTSESSSAYGNNLKQLGQSYCIYSGDVNQDGIIDSGDMISFDNLFQQNIIGYLPEDLNGDGILDILDLLLLEMNAGLFQAKKSPW